MRSTPTAGSITCGTNFLRRFVENFLRLARCLGVLAQVVVAPRRNTPQLLHAEGILEHDIHGPLRVEREFLLRVRVKREMRLGQTDREQPLPAPLDPLLVAFVPVGILVDEILHLHLLKLARAEDEVARRDLVAERLANLRNAERQLHAAGVDHVLEIDEHALRRFGT